MSKEHDYLFHMLNSVKKSFDPENPPEYAAARESEKAMGNKLPEGVQTRNVDLGGIPGELIWLDNEKTDKIIFYVHGGGFTTGSSCSRRVFTGAMAKEFGINVISVEYRLAPEHPYPAAIDDCMTAYKHVLNEYTADKIAFAGESAGGNLVLGLAVRANNENLPLPAAILASSPLIQYDRRFESYDKNLDTDCILSNIHEEIIFNYLKDADIELLRNPVISPYYADLEGFPPVLLSVSESEILYDDSVALYNKLKQEGVDTQLSERSGMMHAYILFQSLPEAQEELQIWKRFLTETCHF